MVGNFIGLWILYLLCAVLAFFGMGAAGIQNEALWEMLAQSALFALLTCVYLKLVEIRGKQKDLEQKLDALLARQERAAADDPQANAPEQTRN